MKLRELINTLEDLSDDGRNDNLEVYAFEESSENQFWVWAARISVMSDGNKYIKIIGE